MVIDSHGNLHAPQGTPDGGRFQSRPGGGADDVEPPAPAPAPAAVRRKWDREEIEAQTLALSDPEASDPSFDDRRTELLRQVRDDIGAYRPMTARDVYDEVMRTGGATWDPFEERAPQVGFCFSPYERYSRPVPTPAGSDELEAVMDGYIRDHEAVLREDGNYLGLWNQEDRDTLWLDVSTVGDDAGRVRDACLTHDQIAFFDLQTKTEVTVDENATSGQGA